MTNNETTTENQHEMNPSGFDETPQIVSDDTPLNVTIDWAERKKQRDKRVKNAREKVEALIEPPGEKVTIDDLQLEVPKPGETVVVLQRNAKDNRDPSSELEIGTLIPEAAEHVKVQTKESLDNILSSLSSEERKKIDFLVVAANTKLDTPLGEEIKSEHKRAVETAVQVLAGIKKSMNEFELSDSQLLNKTDEPIELSSGRMNDLHMLKDSPEFVEFLKNKYGTGHEFWKAYEDDSERKTREAMGAEGPDDIAKRVGEYMGVLANAMEQYHKQHPDRRVIVWVESHYDAISPFIKHAAGMDNTDYLSVDNGAGVVVKLGKVEK
ncbi:MAG: hypothetical protein AAB395_02105 [Patescibacteria group bacterium]